MSPTADRPPNPFETHPLRTSALDHQKALRGSAAFLTYISTKGESHDFRNRLQRGGGRAMHNRCHRHGSPSMSNITRLSRKANAQWNKPANRRARRNAARVLAL